MQTINWKGHGAMFGANAIWGLMSPVAKFVMLGGIVTPLAVTDLRIVGAMILFWILSFFRKSEHVPPKDLAKLFGASLLGVVLNQGSFILGVGMTSPVNASIITTSMPLWAMILAAIFLKEPITAKRYSASPPEPREPCCWSSAAEIRTVPEGTPSRATCWSCSRS